MLGSLGEVASSQGIISACLTTTDEQTSKTQFSFRRWTPFGISQTALKYLRY